MLLIDQKARLLYQDCFSKEQQITNASVFSRSESHTDVALHYADAERLVILESTYLQEVSVQGEAEGVFGSSPISLLLKDLTRPQETRVSKSASGSCIRIFGVADSPSFFSYVYGETERQQSLSTKELLKKAGKRLF